MIVDTVKYHYLAWKDVADEHGVYFDERINERLKGVSRMDSLSIVMENSSRDYSATEMTELAERKNGIYVASLDEISPEDILPGVVEIVDELRINNVKTAICSASRNTDRVLEKLGIAEKFDVVVTGDHVKESKPSPEGVLLAAEQLGISPECCVVVEDAFAGIQAANAAKMKSIGIGDKMLLYNADYVLPEMRYLTFRTMNNLF